MAVMREELFPCCVWLTLLLVHCTALTLSPCVNDGNVRVAEVERGKTSSFTCRGFQAGDIVLWEIVHDSGVIRAAGVCDPLLNNSASVCRINNLEFSFTISRPSASQSDLTINQTGPMGENLLKYGTLRCRTSSGTENATCQIDLISPAVVSACSVKYERVNNDEWRTTGRCDIISANSSRGRYTCRLYRTNGSSAEEEISTVSYTPSRSGSVCNVNVRMPTSAGVYIHRLETTPGEVSTQASGSKEIETPSAPTIPECNNNNYIAENTAVSCTCRTGNVGQPKGQLVWYRAGVPVTYGGSTVTVSQLFTRADHDVTQFRCDVDWAIDVQGESRTFKVGYKPENLSFALGPGSQTEVTVKENNTALFTCRADSRPVANMTVVRQGGSEIRSGQSPLTLTLTASCTDTGTYLCFASNVIGKANTSLSVNIYVECKPRVAQTEPPLQLNYRLQSERLDFDVIAYPPLNASFSSFKFIGPNGTDHASEIRNITLTATCHLKPGVLYISTCTLTVHNMTSPEAEGFYTVTLFNTEGSDDVTFKVLYNAQSEGTPLTTAAIVAIAIAGGVVGVVAAAVVIWLCRRTNCMRRCHSEAH